MNQDNTSDAVFSETQRFRQGWLWVLIVLVAVVIWALLIEQLFLDEPFGSQLMPGVMLVVFWLLFGIGFPALFLFGGLFVQVRQDGIYAQFKPFHLKPRRFAFDPITRCEARTYKALREYGGWGIKCGKGGLSYTVSGDKGVQLEFTEGRPLLIGSQHSEELCRAIQARMR